MHSLTKEAKRAIAAILAVWIFAMGWVLGDNHGFDEGVEAAKADSSATVQTVPSGEETTTATTVPSTNETTTAPAPSGATTIPSTQGADNNTTTQQPTTEGNDPASLSKEQIVHKVNEAVNKVKNEQNMTCHKKEAITITLTGLSVESARNTVNDIIQGIAGEPVDETITVANGIATYPDGTTKPVKEAIPPSNDATKDFKLTADGVATATATKNGENTVYTLILVPEDTTAASPIPTHNSGAIGYLNLMAVKLPSIVTIVDSNMHYPGSTVEVEVNAAGQVVRLVNKMPMTGDGTAKITLLGEGKAEFEGGLDESWEFTY
ncbi:MAG: hypothetical protein IJ491_08800 [Clostridia bacterium]|nr:hypothetical protein [Clostridia bacterium]